MTKVIKNILILTTFLCFSYAGFCQSNTSKLVLDKIILNNCSPDPITLNFILQIKEFEIVVDDAIKPELEKISEKWIQTLSVYKNSSELEKFNLNQNETLIVIKLKKRYWKKLSRKLRDYIINNN